MFQQINCIKSAQSANAIIISVFSSVDSNIANTKTPHQQTMTNVTNRLLKFNPMIKIPVVENHKFFTVITFSNINCIT